MQTREKKSIKERKKAKIGRKCLFNGENSLPKKVKDGILVKDFYAFLKRRSALFKTQIQKPEAERIYYEERMVF